MNTRIWILGLCVIIGMWSSSAAADDSFPIVSEAYQASILGSGHGKGQFTFLEKMPGGAEWEEVSKAAVEVHFDDVKYHVDLDYALDRHGRAKRKVFVFDGDAIMSSEFSPLISRTGAHGDIFPVRGKRATPTSSCGFMIDVARMRDNFLNVPAVLKKIEAHPIAVRKAANGDYFWSSEVNKVVNVTCQFSKKYGYNIASMIVKNGDTVATEKKATWKQKDSVWYMEFYSKKSLRAKEKCRMLTLKYDSFEPNVKVDPALFKMDALDLPPGARVVDRRPEQKNRIGYVVPSREDDGDF